MVCAPDHRAWLESQRIGCASGPPHFTTGRAISNFTRTLPAPQSELAQQVLKDPYTFDFLFLGAQAQERDLERGLLAHMRAFLLELGKGFALVGSQYHLEVGRTII